MRREIGSVALLIHIYSTETGEFETEIKTLTEGDTSITQEELEALIASSGCNTRLPDNLPEIKMSSRIAQALFVLGKVRELAGDDPTELEKKLKTGEISIRDILQKAFHSASEKFQNTYASCQDKMCRQMKMKISGWESMIYEWIVNGNYADIKELLMRNIPNTASRENDVRSITDFFE